MDGFDKISPTHADKAAVILSELKKTKVGRVWVTSLPKHGLEESFVTFFTFKKLSHESQEKMLLNSWISRVKDCEEKLLVSFIKQFLSSANESCYKTFIGNPLNITFLAAKFEQDIETYLKSEGYNQNELLQKMNYIILSKISPEGKKGTSLQRDKVENCKKGSVMNVEKKNIYVNLNVGMDKAGRSTCFVNKRDRMEKTSRYKVSRVRNFENDKISPPITVK